MPKPRLHLDADTSRRGLQRALLEQGHDVTRTPCAWMGLDASDEEQLLGATAQGRVIFTFDVPHFVRLARRYPRHGGIILAAQPTWLMADLISALDEALKTTSADDWIGRVRWLNDWKPRR